jgi:hypothetical protein
MNISFKNGKFEKAWTAGTAAQWLLGPRHASKASVEFGLAVGKKPRADPHGRWQAPRGFHLFESRR